MSAGEINIEVKSEGTDAAAQDAQEGARGGGGGGGGDGTLGTAIRGGIVGGLLSQALGPLVDILDPILKILQAFLAPVAVLLMRLLTPVLRFLIKLLPAWFRFMEKVGPILALLAVVPAILWRLIRDFGTWLMALPGKIWGKMKTWAGKVSNFLRTLPKRIWNFMTRLPSMIGNTIASNVPGVQSTQDTIDRGKTVVEGGFSGDPETSVNIFGGLEQFISQITRDGRIDFR